MQGTLLPCLILPLNMHLCGVLVRFYHLLNICLLFYFFTRVLFGLGFMLFFFSRPL